MEARSVVLCGLALALWPLSAVRANGPAFVPGDLIVKFAAASEPATVVTRAMTGDPAAQPPLAALATRLSSELGVAVVAVRVTSGSELVLSVDRERLAQSLTGIVTRDPAVREVTRLDPLPTVLPAARIELAVELRRDSEAGGLVRRAARAGRTTSAEIDALVRRLCKGADPQPAGRVNPRGQLILVVDVAALTLDLVKRLTRRPDVEYAQPVHIVRPLSQSYWAR